MINIQTYDYSDDYTQYNSWDSFINNCKFNLDNGPWIAGGSARRLYYNNMSNIVDIDIFFNNKNQYERFCSLIKGDPIFTSDNANTYYIFVENKGYKIQLIIKNFYPSADDVINDFDFSISQYITDGKMFKTGKYTLLDEKDKVLRPLCMKNKTIFPRMIKHLILGYKPSPELVSYIKDNKNDITFTFEHMFLYDNQ